MRGPLPPGQFSFDSVREIGAGGLGRVDEIVITETSAWGKDVGSSWARKRLNAKWSQHPIVHARFEREIAALASMSHPNIITLEGENLAGGERFYVMPLFASNLRRFIASSKKCGDWRFAAAQGVILAGALEYAHNLGFIHRDLKPDNLLYNDGGQLVIADWGVGYFVHRESKVLQQLTRGGMGTEYYCSLEQWSTGKCDQRGDIYSLGMTLDELVTGRQRSIVVGAGTGGAPSAQPDGDGARAFNAVLGRMTAPFKSARPSTMFEVALQLRLIAAT